MTREERLDVDGQTCTALTERGEKKVATTVEDGTVRGFGVWEG